MNCKKELSSEIVSVREITGASFTLHFKTYSKELGKTLRNLLTDLPLGVAMKKESRFQEETEPDCKGMETFAPLHEYALSFSGAFQGGIKEIYYLYCKVGRFEVVELGKLELEYGKDLKFPVPG